MRKVLGLLGVAACVAVAAQAGTGAVGSDCTFNGKKLYGTVQFVTSFPDVRVKVVTAFPDVRVQRVTSFPDTCGKWQEVHSLPDLKVQLVDSFPDVEIQYVDAFPGRP
jgi:hypothetical protein